MSANFKYCNGYFTTTSSSRLYKINAIDHSPRTEPRIGPPLTQFQEVSVGPLPLDFVNSLFIVNFGVPRLQVRVLLKNTCDRQANHCTLRLCVHPLTLPLHAPCTFPISPGSALVLRRVGMCFQSVPSSSCLVFAPLRGCLSMENTVLRLGENIFCMWEAGEAQVLVPLPFRSAIYSPQPSALPRIG